MRRKPFPTCDTSSNWFKNLSRSQGLKEILNQARKREKEYDWTQAAELYEKALGMVGEGEFSKKGEIRERFAYCLYRGAVQAQTQKEFKSGMLKAVEAYEKAAEVLEKVGRAKSLYCKAMALYASSWTHLDASSRKGVLDDSRKLMKETIKAFEEAGDRLGYGKACNDLLVCLFDRHDSEWDWTETKRCLEEAMEYGQNALSALSKVEDEGELARAYTIIGLHSTWAGRGYLGEEKRDEFIQTSLSYAEKALELSKKTEDAYLIAWSNVLAGLANFEFTGDLELSLKHAEEGLQRAKKTRDRFLIGGTSQKLATITTWMIITEEDPDKMREGYERVTRYAEDAVHNLLTVYRHDWLPYAYLWYGESYYFLAGEVETDPKERRNLLERAIEVEREGLKYAEQSGAPNIFSVHHGLSKALYSLSKMETRSAAKGRLLEDSLEHREKNIAISEQALSPSDYWQHGHIQNYAALIKAELATIEADEAKKRKFIEEAVSHMERCIELCTKWTSINPGAGVFAAVGWYYGWFGGVLNQLYSLTREEETLEKAVKVYQDTVETYRKAELPTRVAEAYWHAARLYDQLREHTKADRNFQSASKNYKLAAEKVPQLKKFYMDHALYMQAWSEIEKAKHHHLEEKYGQAKEHYEKAANLHELTQRWNYLSPNYSALALMEEAEDLSRREQTEEAKDLFQQAANLFAQARGSIKARQEEIEVTDEKDVATELAEASGVRKDYCLGRIALEEAKILDRKGDHAASSRKYGSAAERFQKATEAMEADSDRQELRPIVYLCRAWKTMTRAEAEASPDMYEEASKLFEEAKEHSLDEKAKMLSLGHSRFCRALAAGTRFEDTRDLSLYSTAKQHLEAAANYYLKAGFKNASEYARATQRLFDAYMYSHKADTETDLKKKAELYRIAGKFLQASAGSFMKAKHPEKSEAVQRLLESVREEQQLVTSLTGVLHAPTATSTTTSFTTPTPTHEQAVGLERFEHADVQANLILRAKEMRVGEDMRLAIEVVNAGKAPALLIKVDEIVPEGFEIKAVPEMYTFEDSYLNMKGKRLNPLKTEDVRVVVKPRSKGTHVIKPRILYIDETGKYKSHEPEPVTIIVKELGIRGWVKGER